MGGRFLPISGRFIAARAEKILAVVVIILLFTGQPAYARWQDAFNTKKGGAWWGGKVGGAAGWGKRSLYQPALKAGKARMNSSVALAKSVFNSKKPKIVIASHGNDSLLSASGRPATSARLAQGNQGQKAARKADRVARKPMFFRPGFVRYFLKPIGSLSNIAISSIRRPSSGFRR